MFGQPKISKNEKTLPNNGSRSEQKNKQELLNTNKAFATRLNEREAIKGSLLTKDNLSAMAKNSGSNVTPLKIDEDNLTYNDGFWLTKEQINELNKVKEEIAQNKRAEAEGDNSEPNKPNVFQRWKDKLFGPKQVEEIKSETVEKSKNNPYDLPDNILTIASINKNKSIIQNNLTNILTERFNNATSDKSSDLFKKLKQKMPELTQNPDFRNYLAHNLHTQQKANDQPGADGKIELSDVSKMSFGDIMQKLRTYKGLEKVGQSDLIARFFVGQIVSLGRAAVKYSKYLEDDHYMALDPKREDGYVGPSTNRIKTALWDEAETAVQKDIQKKVLLGKYGEGGYDQNLFQTIREIIGDDVFQETVDQVFPLGLMQNLSYNEEEKKVETVKLNPEFMGLIENILAPKATETQNIPPLPNNVLQFNPRNQRDPQLGQPVSNAVQLDDRNNRRAA